MTHTNTTAKTTNGDLNGDLDLTIPQRHRAAIYDKPGTISTKLVEVDTPEPGAGEVLIRLTHSGVCHSDLGVMTNSWETLPKPTPAGQIGGHEGVGRVVKLGPGVESSGIKVGDRVGVKWVASVCHRCAPCLAGVDGLCINSTVSGYFRPGTFQQYVVGAADYVTPIPEGLSSASAAPMLCAGVTMYDALKKAQVKGGEWVVISGAGGGLGHIGVQIAARGLGLRVIGIDHGSKRGLVEASGAEHFLDFQQFAGDDIVAEVVRLTGIGAHAALVANTSNKVYEQALHYLRFNGTLVCVGVPEGVAQPIASCKPGYLMVRQLTVAGACVGNRRDAQEVLDFAARGVVDPHHTLVHLDKLTEVSVFLFCLLISYLGDLCLS
ncbi:alcohol dehydrogenase [Capronia epimyces CBS 606.96]|uniref:Alcohol dehydrogenase n=1 Tax=Capronia epimyces CBS 606.96 TaxID=1182542 RepID=W9XD41_9EURO|nr:alcohol dehydrogenase [Capronia epimyces CBS 606.96]EXJ78133.1 alcohol dehydrogenase [Capronia epimyces CBS 606.96]